MEQPPPPPPQPPLPGTPRQQPQRAGARGGWARDPPPGRTAASLARPPETGSLRASAVRVEVPPPPHARRAVRLSCVSLLMRLRAIRPAGGSRAGRGRPGSQERSASQCRLRGRAEPGSGSRPSGSGGGGGGGSSIPRSRCQHSELLLLAGMSVIILSGVAGPLH